MKNYKDILSNERLKDGNEWLKTLTNVLVISVDKYTIIRVTEAIICSTVFNVIRAFVN